MAQLTFSVESGEEMTACDSYNGGCMDECHMTEGQARCRCTHENQYLIKTVHGFCDWSNKTQYCEQGLSGSQDSHLSCEFAQKCILKESVCDGIQDCVDGADEDPNVCSRKTCQEGQFKCHNGRCITLVESGVGMKKPDSI